jgi:lipopolysaccharide biosynthesis protein
MYWARGFALQGLRALNLTAEDFDPESGQVNVTTAHAVERAIGIAVIEAGLTIEERSVLTPPVSADAWRRYGDASREPKARVVPFYLPQFHTFPENDRWWGTGFTEWTNATGALPVYQGHYQPRLPRDTGFYDLRIDAVREQQRDLAAAAGIEGFMYYYYWFAGQRLMDMPIEALHNSDLDQPFCIMWANENWTRRWDGRETDVLIAQDYDNVPAERFIDDVLHLMADERYLTVGGRKVLAVYRPGQMDDFPAVVASWRESARTAGVGELHIVAVDQVAEFHGLVGDPASSGLDASLGFPPHNHLFFSLNRKDLEVDKRFEGNILSYEELVKAAEVKLRAGVPDTYHPGVMVAFDNTPRRQWQPDLWYGSNPYTFRRWLAAAVDAVASRPLDERLVFINAWNEWAEGAVLEPSDRHGKTFLLAVRDVLYG